MAIQKKPVDLTEITTIAQDYNPKINKKVDAEKGKSLVLDTEITKLSSVEQGAQKNNITKVQVNGNDQTIDADGTLNLDVESAINTAQFAKTEEVERDFAKKTDVANLGTIQGTCEQADLESKKEGASVGDCWVVSDDENHIFYYNGTDFVDTGNHIDLQPYLEKTEAESTYAKQTTVQSLTSTVESKLSEDDIVFATTQEVQAALKAGETPAA